MNPLVEIYDNTLGVLRTLSATFPWFDIDIGQLEEDGVELPLQFPCVLIRYEDIIWGKKDVGGIQEGVVNFSVKVVFQFTNETEMFIPMNGRLELTTFLNNLSTLNDSLIAMSGTSFSKPVRFNEYQEKTNPKDLLWVHVMQYQCNVQSDGAIADPDALNVDYADVKDNNAFMDRKKFNHIHK